jgi:hypothetical protein
MANNRVSESELNARYTAAAYRFAQASGWREYLALADEFRALDTYKDSAQKYTQCVKAASAPAYREITDEIRTKGMAVTAEEYREAARVMRIIQDYQDAREVMRVYTVRANALTYDAAMAILSNSQATTEELGEGVALLKTIKGFKNTRELIERFEKYYFDRMYNEALQLMQRGHVFSEFEEAAEMFEKISVYSDAAQQAVACRKLANKVRPKEKKKKEKPAEAAAPKGGDEVVRVTRKDAKAAKDTSAEGDEGNHDLAAHDGQSVPKDHALRLDYHRRVLALLTAEKVGLVVIVSIRTSAAWAVKHPDIWNELHLSALEACVGRTKDLVAQNRSRVLAHRHPRVIAGNYLPILNDEDGTGLSKRVAREDVTNRV